MRMSDRKTISLSTDDYETIRKAAYWEGFKGPAAFTTHVMMKYIASRENERNSRYKTPPIEPNDIDD